MTHEEMQALRFKVSNFVNEAYLDCKENYSAVTSTKYQSLVMLELIVLEAIANAQRSEIIREIANQPTPKN